MDKEKFKRQINKEKNESNLIGTLSEKTLHRVVKNYYEEDESFQEIKVGPYFADVLKDNKIIEIQTKQFFKLIPKIEYFLKEGYEVRVVYPTFFRKTVYWVNKETKEISKGKLSPKKGKVFDVIEEMYSLRSFLNEGKFKISILLMNLNEYRLLDGWSENKKRGSHRIDRIPTELVDEINLEKLEDFNIFYSEELPETFTSFEYAKAVKTNKKMAQMALIVLTTLSVVKRIGKKGNAYIYTWNKR